MLSEAEVLSETTSEIQQDVELEEAVGEEKSSEIEEQQFIFDINELPKYEGNPYYILNNNNPLFTEEEKKVGAFSEYSELDSLGRCGVAFANVSQETIPKEERGTIGDIQPSGWHTVKYNDIIDGNYLYNRCHLVAYQLAGDNASPENLITGTRYLNMVGMLPFENAVFDYIKTTPHHVLYRVTPVFEGDNLVASGVTMEAFSVEDDGEGIGFFVYVYNIQPGVIIDYLTGESELDPNYVRDDNEKPSEKESEELPTASIEEDKGNQEQTYILNTNTKKFHRPNCKSVDDMKEKNKKVSQDSRDELIKQGYSPCKRCNP